MPKGIMTVHSAPASEAEAGAYHDWYDNIHIPELLKVEGFASATRYESVDGDGFLAIYELDVEPETAKANQSAAQASGTMTPPAGLRLDPPPTVRYYRAR
jgi:hypothetical protein